MDNLLQMLLLAIVTGTYLLVYIVLCLSILTGSQQKESKDK